MKPRGINRQGMYGVFDAKGNLIIYSIDYTIKEAITNACDISGWSWSKFEQEGYFTHRIDVFIIPVTTIKVPKP